MKLRKLLPLLGLLLFSCPAKAAFTRVNISTNQASASNTTIASTATSFTAGNVGVVMVFGYDAGGGSGISVSGVTDTAGNTYVLCKYTDSDSVMAMWSNTTTLGNASNVVTATFTGGVTNRMIIVVQYTGILTGTGCETNGSAHLNGTTVTSSSFSPASSGNLNVAFTADPAQNDGGSGTWTAGGSYTNFQFLASPGGGSGAGMQAMDLLAGAASGAQTASQTYSVSTPLDIIVGSFKPAVGVGGTISIGPSRTAGPTVAK
jgi:hypothetical protein